MKNKKGNSLYAKLVNFFKSKTIRNITLSILIVFSSLTMFLLDENNYIRNEYLTFLNTNLVSKLMDVFNISRYNITVGAWLIYLCIFFVSVVLIVGNIFSSKFVDKKAEANQNKFKSYRNAYRLYSFIYNLVLTLIAGAIIFIFGMLGGFSNMTKDTTNVFVSLIYAVLLCLLFLLLIPITIFLVYFVIKLVILVVSFIVSKIANTVKDINASSDLHAKKAEALLNEARKNAGLPVVDTTIDDSVQTAPINKDIFYSLTLIDEKPVLPATNSTEITLEELALRFQSYAINHHKIYYELPIIRAYIAGLSASRLIILEGLSGTGKSMLPRVFSKFTQSVATFHPVQASWRDKTDLFGFYSEFSKSFKITDFLMNLYSASYSDKINEMVLDEVNLSRIEYYFADLLSVMEYPEEDWKVKVYDPAFGQKLPAKLEGGYIKVPNNTWFIGTANTDDSTYTITDKVYDRAIVIDFREKFAPITSKYNSDPIELSSDALIKLFDEARENDAYKLTKTDSDKFFKICSFVKDAFDIRFGNRIMVQIESFVPVYVALGGTKEEALDFMFARKILRKLGGVYQDYVKEELIKLKKLIEDVYGKGVFKETELVINKITKRLV